MPKERKTERGKIPIEVMNEAANLVINHKVSNRIAADQFGIPCHVTLHRFVTKLKKGLPASVGYNPAKKVFTPEQEIKIVNYIIKAADHYYGMGPITIRKFVYQLAVKYKCRFPDEWNRGMFIQFIKILPHYFKV